MKSFHYAFWRPFLIAWIVTGCASPSPAQVATQPDMATPLQASNLDGATFAQWIDGTENSFDNTVREQTPPWVIWTDKSQPGHSGISFGNSKTPGARHLRIGFKAPIPIGSVLVRGGGALSVLKPDAAYPGDMNQESQWTPAQRLQEGQVSRDEVDRDEYALWTLPPGTETRALRFTHVASPTDASFAGFLGGAFVSNERDINLAPLAVASASANSQKAARLINGTNDGDRAVWANADNTNNSPVEARPAISPDNPQWVLLTWPAPVKLSGLNAIWAGFSAAEAQVYIGSSDKHPRDATEADWKTIVSFAGLKNGYPIQLWPNRLDFGQVVTTRAIRLKLEAPTNESHPHLKGDTQKGSRVWLGELMALQSLDKAPLVAVNFPVTNDAPHAPIPVRFKLDKPGLVTLVIEDSKGRRVRNLISEMPFPTGDNVAWWDGTDDLGRDIDAARHGLYNIPAQFVAPGSYRVRGLVHDPISPHYEFAVYTGGNPPWPTPDHTGAWLSNHTPPQAAMFVPAAQAPGGKPLIFLGSYVSEGRDGLAWVDLQGRKVGGEKWVGGNWTGAPYLARDEGPNALPGIYGYVASVWATEKGSTKAELRITALTPDGDKAILRSEFDPKDAKNMGAEISGFAVRDGILVVSMPQQKQLLFADAKAGKVIGTSPIENTRGLGFDAKGSLLALADTKLLRFDRAQAPLGTPQTVISGLQDPQQMTFDAKGNFYISDRKDSHQVKVFDANGKWLRAIGKAGAPKAGPYDPLHMNNPAGLAIDSDNHLWVTENDFLPKRVSVWTLDGQLVKAFYGPGKYGGGGTIDSQDKTRFYYADEGRGAMEFKLDWQSGQSQLTNVYYRRSADDLPLAFRSAAPETALYHDGKRYFTNCYNSSPTSGHGTAFLFLEQAGIARPVAAMGRGKDWDVLQTDAFKPRLPAGSDWTKNPPFFIWSDANADGKVQPEEVQFQNAANGGVTVMPDLSFCVSRVGDNAMRFAPTSFSAQGVPAYDMGKGVTLIEKVQGPASSGGDQVLSSADGWTVVTLGSGPFARQSLSGGKAGQASWSYPSLWPGLHASHEAPQPAQSGELIGTTRLLGGLLSSKNAGLLWAVNSNMGHFYLFTADGLFVSDIFKDARQGKSLAMPQIQRDLALDDFTLHDENFWPTITQTPDGNVYAVDGGNMSIVRLDGLDSLRRLPDVPLQLGAADLQKAQTFIVDREAERQKNQGRGVLEVALRGAAPTVDGDLSDWKDAAWVDIDKRGVAANFNSNSKPYSVSGALAVAGDRLYAAWRTGDADLVKNTGEVPTAPFKTGGALDLMLATDPKADPKRSNPVVGDLRLLVTRAKGKTMAVLYRAVVAGTKTPVPFSSPWRTITLDRADDVSDQVQFGAKDGNYEMSIPLAVLGLQPQAGQPLRGDIGILRGDGSQTTARIYWSNKATGITADVPSEAQLMPQLWGPIEFKATP